MKYKSLLETPDGKLEKPELPLLYGELWELWNSDQHYEEYQG